MSAQKIIGIDFSGAKDAGRNIWISIGTESSGTLQISSCEQAANFFKCGKDKYTVYDELVDWIDSLQNATIGIDFPFSVPQVVVKVVFNENSWEGFVNSNTWSRMGPERFRKQCASFSNSELRDTDAIHRADFPHSIRVYKQTFYGIKDILQPLLQYDVSVAPMVKSSRNTTILETYPAATLAREDNLFATRYKNRSSTRPRRKHNAQELSRLNDLDLRGISTSKIVDDRAGDAMDSIVAALATFRASNSSSPFKITPRNPLEGHIYV